MNKLIFMLNWTIAWFFLVTCLTLFLSTGHTNLHDIPPVRARKTSQLHLPWLGMTPTTLPPSLWWVKTPNTWKRGQGLYPVTEWIWHVMIGGPKPLLTGEGVTWVPHLCSWTWGWRWRSWGRGRALCSWSSQCRSGSAAGRPPRRSSGVQKRRVSSANIDMFSPTRPSMRRHGSGDSAWCWCSHLFFEETSLLFTTD